MKTRLRRNPILLFLARLMTLWGHRASARRRPKDSLRYLLSGQELSTFTYDLGNLPELASCIGKVLGVEPAVVSGYMNELEHDDELREALAAGLRTRANRRNSPRYTKRPGYYALTRIVKPETVVETGTHDGVGAAVIARALMRNAAEGGPVGKIMTFDINPAAGWIIPSFLDDHVQRIIGPTSQTLGPALEGEAVDFFVHDSLRTSENERSEFATVIARAHGPNIYLATDHGPDTDVLRDLCKERGAPYAAFREEPLDHFFAGVELGLSVMNVGPG